MSLDIKLSVPSWFALVKTKKIPMTEKMETEVEHMCNLSDGVEQKGIQKGIEIGIEQGIM